MTDAAADRAFLTRLFEAAVAAADPVQVLPRHLPPKPAGKTVVIGAGKGAAQLPAAARRAGRACARSGSGSGHGSVSAAELQLTGIRAGPGPGAETCCTAENRHSPGRAAVASSGNSQTR